MVQMIKCSIYNYQVFGKISDFRKKSDFWICFLDFQHPQRALLETCGLRLDTWDTDYILTINNNNINNYIVTLE